MSSQIALKMNGAADMRLNGDPPPQPGLAACKGSTQASRGSRMTSSVCPPPAQVTKLQSLWSLWLGEPVTEADNEASTRAETHAGTVLVTT